MIIVRRMSQATEEFERHWLMLKILERVWLMKVRQILCINFIFIKHYYQYDALIGDGRAGEEAPSCEGGAHVQMHPTSDLCKPLI